MSATTLVEYGAIAGLAFCSAALIALNIVPKRWLRSSRKNFR